MLMNGGLWSGELTEILESSLLCLKDRTNMHKHQITRTFFITLPTLHPLNQKHPSLSTQLCFFNLSHTSTLVFVFFLRQPVLTSSARLQRLTTLLPNRGPVWPVFEVRGHLIKNVWPVHIQDSTFNQNRCSPYHPLLKHHHTSPSHTNEMQLLAFPRGKPTQIELTISEVHKFYPAQAPANLIPHYFPPSKQVPILLDLGQSDRDPLVFTLGAEPVSFNILPVREQTKELWAQFVTAMPPLRGNARSLRVLEIAHLVTVEAHAHVAIRLPDGSIILASDFGTDDLIARLTTTGGR